MDFRKCNSFLQIFWNNFFLRWRCFSETGRKGDCHALPHIHRGADSDGSPKGQGSGPQLCGFRPSAAGADAGSRRHGAGAAAAGGGAGTDGGPGPAALRSGHAGSAPAPGADGGSASAFAGRGSGGKAAKMPGDTAQASGAGHGPAGKLRGGGIAPGQRRQPGDAVYTYRGLFTVGAADAAQGKKGGCFFETVGAVQRGSGGQGGKHGAGHRTGKGNRYGGGHPVPEV